MEIQRAIELLKIEQECLKRNELKECNRECASCDIVQDSRELYRMYSLAIKVLSEKSPHILTLDEALSAPYVWLEANPSGLGVRQIKRSTNDDTILLIYSFPAQPSMADADMYGVMFRAWSDKPSVEQRKANKW